MSETKYEPLMIDCMNRCREECKREVNVLKNTQLNFDEKLTPITSEFLSKGGEVQLRGAHHYVGKQSLAAFIRDLKKKYKVLNENYKEGDIKDGDTVYLEKKGEAIFLIIIRNGKFFKQYLLGSAKELLDTEDISEFSTSVRWSGASEKKGEGGRG
ncbi:MAG: hypothetical protein ACYTBY_04955, partial [Planctomycetota bacterium]